MEMKYLDKPITIAGHEIRNRICMPPLVFFNTTTKRDGMVNQVNIDHYEKRAKAGTGLIVVEATCISEEGRLAATQLGLWQDEHIENHSKIVDACHKNGAVIIVQIHHAGVSVNHDCGEAVGPSKIIYKDRKVRELNVDEIQSMHKQFVDAVLRAKKAGYDGVQLHGCHAYLLNAFASKHTNFREDEYGGNAENRTRLACGIIKEIREKCGENFIVAIRMAGNDPTPEIGVENAKCYIDAGVDMLSVSSGLGPMDSVQPPQDFPLSDIAWLGVNIKNHYPDIPVAAVYGIKTREQAEKLAGYVDFVSVGKAMLANADWSAYALTGKEPETKCIGCKSCQWFTQPKKCPALYLPKRG